MRGWSIQDSVELYNVRNWGRDFFRINEAGNVEVTPAGPRGESIDLKQLVDDLVSRDLQPPLLIRFTDILEHRVRTLAGAFKSAIREYEYQGNYRGVFPIKVNQQRHLVEDYVKVAATFHMGLECGSKPELLIVLAMMDDPQALILCNGYKDNEFIETALMAKRLGRNPIIVVEKFSEFKLVCDVADRVGVAPVIGMRAKLASKGAGRWEGSAGDRAKFGLTVGEMVEGIKYLKERNRLDSMQLLHFHIGSQVSAIRSVKNALREAARLYTGLVKLGAPMKYFDVGGGLGVDYDGSRSNFESSVNYTIDEYAADVVAAVQGACDEAEVAHPTLITESGRAMAAHHSVLVFNVLGVTEFPTAEHIEPVTEDEPEALLELHEICQGVTRKTYQEAYHDALAAKEEVLTLFNVGNLDLVQRARAEKLFWQACQKILTVARQQSYVPDELEGLEKTLADTYFCNFSVFQSAPDSWAVDQLFPVMPIHRLNQEPTRKAILADITCDSDGKIDKFIDLRDVKDVLELHPFREGEPYYLALFLVGAYQEILGDLHNLFGDTNAVHVSLDDGGGYSIDHVIEGDTVTEVLSYVQFSKADLVRRVRRATELAMKEGRMTVAEAAKMVQAYQSGLDGYTYLEE
ncbi:biosynthetic arginine decarboxylase [Deltaproteobacteria bacterium]|nr:biosynthetic arginine decarboxylase [Deltaproteobacteria bacterium]